MAQFVGAKQLVAGRGPFAGVADPSFRLEANTGQVSLMNNAGQHVIGWAPSPWLLDEGQFGGYTQVVRTARRGVTTYEGVDAVSMSGTLLLDGWGAQDPVSQMVTSLRAMASPSGTRDLTPPQPVFVTGTVEVPARWWVIASLTPGRENGSEVALRESDGVALRRSYAVVLLTAPVDAVLLTNGKKYTARNGDTPIRVASSQLGKGSRWKELKKSNGKHWTDAKAKIKAGTVVILP